MIHAFITRTIWGIVPVLFLGFASAVHAVTGTGRTTPTHDPSVPQFTDYTGINQGDSEKKYRHRLIRAYLSNEEVRRRMKTNSYSSFENPTGIFFKAGETAEITVSGLSDHPLNLLIWDYKPGRGEDRYPLHEGKNSIIVKNPGLAYIDYRDVNPGSTPVITVDIGGGAINGVFTPQDSQETWKRLLAGAVCDVFDMLGERCQLTFEVESLRKYCPEQGPELLALYDHIIELEQDEVLGWKKDKSHPGNHIHGRVQWTGFMHADGYGAAYVNWTMKDLANVDRLCRSSWGVAHEFGHVNQTRPGMLWVGTTEITNNICSAWVNYKLCPEHMRLEHEVCANADKMGMRGGRFDCFVNSAIVKRQLWQFQAGGDRGLFSPLARYDSGDVFVGLAPFWQLMLYNTVARGNKDFYPSIYHSVRSTDESKMTNGELRALFMKRACDAAKLNLTDYFLKTGMAAPVDREVDDYGVSCLTVTDEMVQEVLNYISRYPKPDSDVIYYITANSVHIYRDKLNIETSPNAPKIELPVGRVDIPGDAWKNAVAFEAYSGKKLIRVSLLGLNHEDNTTTTVICPPETDTLKAVQWDGKRVTIARLSNDKETRERWQRGVLLSQLLGAIETGQTKTLRKLLKEVEDVNAPLDDGGNTLLNAAIEAQKLSCVQALLKAGADPNVARKRDGKTMLHVAAGLDNTAIARELISAGANLQALSGNGAYPIHEAVWNNKPRMLRLLLPYYRDCNYSPNGGINGYPVTMAINRENPQLLEEILKVGIDVNDACFADEPLLIQATKRRDETKVRMLLKAGANRDAVDRNGKKAIDYAEGSLRDILR